MTTNFLRQGGDIDVLFAPYEGGTKKALTGYLVNGTDLRDRYAPIEQGTAAIATGLLVGAADLNTLFAALGSVNKINGAALAAMQDLDDGDGLTTASCRLRLLSNGTWQTHIGQSLSFLVESGTWLDTSSGAVGNDYEVMYTWTFSGGGAAPGLSQNTWYSLGANVDIAIADSSPESTAFLQLNGTIRKKTNTANSVTWYMEMSADGECFAVGTMLRTPDGDRLVEELAGGDIISSFSEPTMPDESDSNWRDWTITSLADVDVNDIAAVAATRRFTAARSIKVNGLHTTVKHIYFVFDGAQYGWKQAQAIVAGVDAFVDIDMNLVPITSVELIDAPTEFVAVDVEQLDTLQVKSGDTYILAHNASS